MIAISRRMTVVLAALLAIGSAIAGVHEDARADNAVRVLREIQSIPESSIPDRLLEDARAIVVVPDTIKAGFMLGGRRGLGLLSVRRPDGSWSNPVFVKLSGASFGFQAGVQSADVVLVFRSDRGLDNIVNGKFTLGADASVAAGPVGRNAAAATDGSLKAEIWSWSRARGLFAGVALDGAVLQIDHGANRSAYGDDVTPRMIFEGRSPKPSAAIAAFRTALEEATTAARYARQRSEAARAPTPPPAGTATAAPLGADTPVTSAPLPSSKP